mgnify:FL=1
MTERTTKRDNMYQARNRDKTLFFFANEADAQAAANGDRTALRKKLTMQGFTHPNSLGYDGLKALDRKVNVPDGAMKPVYVVCLQNVGDVDVDVADDWGDDWSDDSSTSEGTTDQAPF